MKKLATVFVIAVLVPAVALAWLATRSLRDQELIVHSQRALLHQGATDSLAGELNLFLDDIRIFYGDLLEKLIAEKGADELARHFDEILREHWSQARLGAVVSENGEWLNPPLTATEPETRNFLADTRPFLMNAARSDFYLAPSTIRNNVVTIEPSQAERGSLGERFSRRSELPVREEPMEAADRTLQETEMSAQAEIAPPTAPAPTSPEAPSAVAATPSLEASDEVMAASGLQVQAEVQQQKVAVKEPTDRRQAEALAFDSPAAAEAQPQTVGRALEGAGAGGSSRPPVSQAEAGTSPADDLPEISQRARNVRPLGQLQQSMEEGQGFSRFAKAATDALADNPNRLAWSTLDLNRGELREKMGDAPEGAVSRFVSDGLQVLLWRRDPSAPDKIFWVELNLRELRSDLARIVEDAAPSRGPEPEICLALLDATGEVVARSVDGFTTDWRQPFVATEVGEILPHWEVAAYLLDPRAVARSARDARLLLWMLIPFLLVAIGIGGFLIMREIGREMRLARQKTDFVSNVSHELKTPLTSIRMFSDLLGTRRDLDEGKRAEYSGIISRESARLSRLINNLLDFSRMERGEKRYRMEPIAIRDFLLEMLETCRHQIESDGFDLRIDCPDSGEGNPRKVIGDRDALAQVLLNLLSNAEKYGGDAREIAVELRCACDHAEIAVLDRGPGIPRKQAEKIFEKFYRADDSLASGIEGSGLGLTLARQIARAHRGDLVHRPRPGGGSRFVLTLPLVSPTES